MIKITTLERKLNAIRTTDEYQRMYKIVEELDGSIKQGKPADHDKMVEVCRYVNPDLWPEDYFESMTGDDLEEEYMECAEYVKEPYVCLFSDGNDTNCEYQYDSLEMAYIRAFEGWRISTQNYEREKYEKNRYIVAAMNDSHDEYCVFKRDCNLDEVTRILRMEYMVSDGCGFDWMWLKKFCRFAEEKDPEFDPVLKSPLSMVTDEEEKESVKKAEEILGISLTEW